MPKPVCVKCGKFFRVKKNGVAIEEGMPSGPVDDTLWEPYKLWNADLWECKTCGFQMVTGFAKQPISEHYRLDYEWEKKLNPPIVFVRDC